MSKRLDMAASAADRFGLAGVIAAKATCLVGMQLSLLLGLAGASGLALPLLDPINRIVGPISLPLFVVSLVLMVLGAVRRGPVALALVVGGGILLYAAIFARGMSLPLYGLAMAMLITPFLAGPLGSRLRRLAEPSAGRDVSAGIGE